MIVYSDFNRGRLGNQLFFVAATIGIATKNNTSYGFTSQLGHSGQDYRKIFKLELPLTNYIPDRKYYQKGFEYEDINVKEADLIGYFQTEKFFDHCVPLIKKQFEIKDEFIELVTEKYPSIKSSISIHIRRGDYLNQPNHHPVLPESYYNSILEEVSDNYDNVYVFTDDKIWAKEKFTTDKFIIPDFEYDDDLLSFVLLCQSKDFVISNSSYSWWAAWLSDNLDKKVYCPTNDRWFGPSYSNLDTKDLLPDNWIKIKCT